MPWLLGGCQDRLAGSASMDGLVSQLPMWGFGVIGISAVYSKYSRGPKALPCGKLEFMREVGIREKCCTRGIDSIRTVILPCCKMFTVHFV